MGSADLKYCSTYSRQIPIAGGDRAPGRPGHTDFNAAGYLEIPLG